MPKTRGSRYVTVQVPVELVEAIDKIIELGKYGYRSRSEFVADAIRRRLDELKE